MNKAKICIIDDNEAVCDAVKFLFHSFFQLEVSIYHDPLIFLDEFSPTWEGCLIIDLFIPSINGIELVKHIKKMNNNLKIIIISGHGTAETASQSLEAGANMFITKPFKTEDLLKNVVTFLP